MRSSLSLSFTLLVRPNLPNSVRYERHGGGKVWDTNPSVEAANSPIIHHPNVKEPLWHRGDVVMGQAVRWPDLNVVPPQNLYELPPYQLSFMFGLEGQLAPLESPELPSQEMPLPPTDFLDLALGPVPEERRGD